MADENIKKKGYVFKTGLKTVKEHTRASPYICGDCGRDQPYVVQGMCHYCKHRILYKKRPRIGVTFQAR